MKKFLLCLFLLFNLTPCFAGVDCSQYPYDENKISEGWDYAHYFLQCTIDKKITPLNRQFKFKEQEEIWDTVNFVLEHKYDDAEKYENGIPKNLPGKYNTMEKLDRAVFKEYTLYELGMIATGKIEYIGPDYMFGDATWKDYYPVVIEKYKDLRNFNELERLVFIQRIENQIEYFRNKATFSNSYYFNTYVMHLIGLAKNNPAIEGEYGFNYYIKRLYLQKKLGNEILQFVNDL